MASILHGLRITYTKMTQYAMAEDSLQKAVQSFEEVRGLRCPSALAAMCHLAECYRYQHNLDRAVKTCHRIFELSKGILSAAEDQAILSAQEILAACYSVQGKPKRCYMICFKQT